MSSTEEKHNGWANVETWRVQLHLANDEQTAATVGAMIRSFVEGNDPPESCEEWLRKFVTIKALPDAETELDNWGQFSSDVVQAALSRVDWRQLADYWTVVDVVEDGRSPT
jgi:hypothetical protein